MKKLFAVLLLAIIIISTLIVPASAAVIPGETKFSAKKGDTIEYVLNMTLPEKLVGCDLSVYYDSSVLKITDYADFTGYDDNKHSAAMNPSLKDEFLLVWTNLSGESFNNKAITKLKFEVIGDVVDTHITYYVRYLYPENLEQYTDYKFTCDLKVNDNSVISAKAPELELEREQTQGLFVNSLDGDGKNAGDFEIINTEKEDKTEEKTEPTEQSQTEEPEVYQVDGTLAPDTDDLSEENVEESEEVKSDKKSIFDFDFTDGLTTVLVIIIVVAVAILLSVLTIFIFRKKKNN